MTEHETQETDLATLRQKAAELSGAGQQTAAVERKILDAATDRLLIVRQRLDQLSDTVNTDTESAAQYQQLYLEKGRLELVIANAGQALK